MEEIKKTEYCRNDIRYCKFHPEICVEEGYCLECRRKEREMQSDWQSFGFRDDYLNRNQNV